jgi:RNA polymerase sigma factor (sigma-70 family)
MPEFSEGIPKPSLGRRIIEKIKKITGQKPEAPVRPEGSDESVSPEKTVKKQPRTSGQNVEEDIITKQQKEKAYNSLTPREKEVYRLIFESGMTNAEAAKELGVTDEAIRHRRTAIESKFRYTFKRD